MDSILVEVVMTPEELSRSEHPTRGQPWLRALDNRDRLWR